MTSFRRPSNQDITEDRASTSNNGDVETEKRPDIKDVRKKFMEQSDASLAQKLQNEEFSHKYNWNRADRRTARQDVPLARIHQTEEEQRMERERLEQLERHKKIAEKDAIIAAKIHEEEKIRKSSSGDNIEEDSKIALQLQKEELMAIERDKKRREQRDQELARQLQANEKDMRKMSVDDDTHSSSRSTRRTSDSLSNGRTQGQGGQRSLYKTTHLEDLSDDEQKRLCMLQDEEIARALQERENMKAKSVRRHTSTSQQKSDIERELELKNQEINRLLREKEELEEAMHNPREGGGSRHGGGGHRNGGSTRTVQREEVIRREVIRTETDRDTVSRQASEPIPSYGGRVGGGSGGSRSLTHSQSTHSSQQQRALEQRPTAQAGSSYDEGVYENI